MVEGSVDGGVRDGAGGVDGSADNGGVGVGGIGIKVVVVGRVFGVGVGLGVVFPDTGIGGSGDTADRIVVVIVVALRVLIIGVFSGGRLPRVLGPTFVLGQVEGSAAHKADYNEETNKFEHFMFK